MNNKSFVVVLIISGLILSTLIVRDGKPLLLAVPFLIYLMIGILQTPSEITLVAERVIDKPSVAAHEPVEVRVIIENRGHDLVNLHLDDSLFPTMTTVAGQIQQRLLLPAKGMTELRYVFSAARGVYSWNTIHASAGDPFGLFEFKRDIPAFAGVVIRPAPMKLQHITFKPRSTLYATGSIAAGLAGPGIDFFGTREYRTGDSLRWINWRLAARHPRKFFTNEYEREEIADFGIILDARKLTDADEMEGALFESSICAAAALSEIFLKAGNRVALLIFGEVITSLFPGYGKRQLNLVLQNLAGATQGSNLSFRYLEYFPTRLFPSRSVIVMFSPVTPRDLGTYARLRSFGYDILLISPDSVDYSARTLPATEINALAVRAARVERIILLKRLIKMGVQVIDWQIDRPLGTVFNEVAGNFTRRRNIQG
jgi:uncharacterized protein (DUF58 family)